MPKSNSSIRKRSDGRWEGRLFLGTYSIKGQPQYKSIYGTTQREVKQKLLDAEQRRQIGVDLTKENTTLEVWMSFWLTQYKKNQVQVSTYEGYAYNATHIYHCLGRVKLAVLKPELIQNFLTDLHLSGTDRKMKICHMLLNASLKQAVINGLLPKNPVDGVRMPAVTSKEAAVMSLEQQKAFLEALKGEACENALRFQLATGMRPGEVIAIRWQDIGFQSKTLTIAHGIRRQKKEDGSGSELLLAPTKTKRSRKIELLDEAMEILELQKLQQYTDKQALGSGYTDLDMVFATRLGTMMDRNNFNRVFVRLREKMQNILNNTENLSPEETKLPRITAHSLRHTFATRALELDVPLKVVADWLGHSTIRITGDTYSHALAQKRRVSMDRMSGMTKDPAALMGQNRGQTKTS